MTRSVQSELLDSLPPTAPAALRSRRELRWINAIMGNHRWLSHTLQARYQAGQRVLELGAGDGALAQRVAIPHERWAALDLAPPPQPWPAAATWHQADLLKLDRLPDAEILLANLFLHHFQTDQLSNLGRKIPNSCRLMIACEPARRPLHLWQGRALCPLLWLSHVTRHDMLVSIRAGFLDDELPHGLALDGWQWTCSTTLLGAYRLIAWR